MFIHLFIYSFLYSVLTILFIFRERGRKGEREGGNEGGRKRGQETSMWERNIDWLPLAGAWTRNRTQNPLLCRKTHNQLSHAGEGGTLFINMALLSQPTATLPVYLRAFCLGQAGPWVFGAESGHLVMRNGRMVVNYPEHYSLYVRTKNFFVSFFNGSIYITVISSTNCETPLNTVTLLFISFIESIQNSLWIWSI